MRLSRRIRFQLGVLAVVALVAGGVMVFGYAKVPALLGIGRYSVAVELPRSGGLYPAANVTYSGTKVGRVTSVGLTEDGTVRAVLSLADDFQIPSDLVAEVHSQSALGEQYMALVPRNADSPPLRDGDIIAVKDTVVPPAIDEVLDATNRGLMAIPRESLKTVIDESYIAIGGLGPELSRLIRGASTLAIDARANLDALTALVDKSAPVLNSQGDTADEISAWAAHLAGVTAQLRSSDAAVAGVLSNGPEAAGEARALIEQLKPTLPVLLSNLAAVNQITLAYQPAIEQLLVLIPQGVAMVANAAVPNLNNPSPYAAGYLYFNLNINLPPPCTTGYLPAAQRRTPAETDAPDRIEGDLYCRIPQDAPQNVRGARNLPCLTRPGKRAPTVKMCESDETYIPLNDGNNWKGDPNATTSGQGVPQYSSVPPPAAAIAPYDPATGSFIGPDGKVNTRTDLAEEQGEDKTWQDMLVPPR
jgi:phospholipid/cholesterol/gamma-HCH transport system substrate-binding protein